MFKKSYLFVLSIVICMLLQSPVFAQDPQGTDQATQATAVRLPDARYTMEEFMALSSEEKKNIYYYNAQLLPENFNQEVIKDILNPAVQQ